MIAKNKYVSSRHVSPGRASSALKSHLKYIQYRERGENETRQERHLFSKESEQVDRKQVHAAIMQQEQAGDIYYHRLILSPSQEEPVHDFHQWTRDVMQELEREQGKELDWYATVHTNTDNPHVHVVLNGTGQDRETGTAEPVSLSREDFQTLREAGREHSQYEHYQQIQETLRDLDRDDQNELHPPERDEPLPAFAFPGSDTEGLER